MAASKYLELGFFLGGFCSVVDETGVQTARPTSILKSPGPQGGQSRPRDSATTVRFDTTLSDISEESSSPTTSSPSASATSEAPRDNNSRDDAEQAPLSVPEEVVAQVLGSGLGRMIGLS